MSTWFEIIRSLDQAGFPGHVDDSEQWFSAAGLAQYGEDTRQFGLHRGQLWSPGRRIAKGSWEASPDGRLNHVELVFYPADVPSALPALARELEAHFGRPGERDGEAYLWTSATAKYRLEPCDDRFRVLVEPA